jgi:hypothetical protein
MKCAAIGLVFGAAVVVCPHLALAQPPAAPAMSDADLGRQRAGVATPFGFDIGFGAQVRTYVDGTLALESRLTWTKDGALIEHTSGPSAPGLAAMSGGPWTTVVSGAAGGSTTVLHDLSPDRIGSLVLNTASNRTIRQETNITLTLPQLPDLQRQMAAERTASMLQGAVSAALTAQTGK